jgi:anti-anti-sigma factor
MDVQAALEVTVTTDAAGRRVVGLIGELDLATAARATTILALTIRDADVREIIVDLDELRFVDACGLRVLVGALRQAEDLDRSLCARNPRGEVDMLLRLTGLADPLGVPHIPVTSNDRTSPG